MTEDSDVSDVDYHDDIVIVMLDDHNMVAEAISHMLGAEPDLAVAVLVDDPSELVAAVNHHDADVVLVDPLLSDNIDVMRAIPDVLAAPGHCKVIVLTTSVDERLVRRSILAGADGFLSKSDRLVTLKDAIRDVVDGEQPFTDKIPEPAIARRRTVEVSAVSDREMEVLQLLAMGQSTTQVAETLFLSVNTVRNHIQRTMKKLKAHNRLEAVSIAIRLGMVTLDSSHTAPTLITED